VVLARDCGNYADGDIEWGSTGCVLNIQFASAFHEKANEGCAAVHALMQERRA